MLRIPSRIVSSKIFRPVKHGGSHRFSFKLVRRSSSDSGGSSGKGKLAMGGIVTILSVAGGTLAYAGMDTNFRNYIEGTIPGAEIVFGSVLGHKTENSSTAPVHKSSLLKSTPPSSTIMSTPVQLASPTGNDVAKVTVNVIDPPLEPPPNSKSLDDSTSVKLPEKKNDSYKKKNLSVPPIDPSKSIDNVVADMQRLAHTAVEAGEICVISLDNHTRLVRSVLEGNIDESKWKEVFAAAADKKEAIKQAETKFRDAEAAIKKVRESTESLKKEVGASGTVRGAEEEMKGATVLLHTILAKIEEAQKESVVTDEYREQVEKAREMFRKELVALSPDFKTIGGGMGKNGSEVLSEEELDLLLTHAYNKVTRLQQELAKEKTIHLQQLRSSVKNQNLQTHVQMEELVEKELDAQRWIMEADHQRRTADLKDKMEAELRLQLKRQSAAHTDHLKDALNIQEIELSRKYQKEKDEAVHQERISYSMEVSKLAGSVEGLKEAVRRRKAVQAAAKEAQELWLVCCALKRSLETEMGPSNTPLPIDNEVEAIRKVSKRVTDDTAGANGSSAAFVEAVLESIPAQVLSKGVHTYESIRERFFKVERVAKRTALIEDDDSSLLLYLLSYLQSFLVVTPSTERIPDKDVAIDLSSLSTFDILWLARGCLERGDLEQAVKYMTLLHGQPRQVSRDWIRDATYLLEIRQACDALIAHAEAFGLEALPFSMDG